jgi:hypothetical protein
MGLLDKKNILVPWGHLATILVSPVLANARSVHLECTACPQVYLLPQVSVKKGIFAQVEQLFPHPVEIVLVIYVHQGIFVQLDH